MTAISDAKVESPPIAPADHSGNDVDNDASADAMKQEPVEQHVHVTVEQPEPVERTINVTVEPVSAATRILNATLDRAEADRHEDWAGWIGAVRSNLESLIDDFKENGLPKATHCGMTAGAIAIDIAAAIDEIVNQLRSLEYPVGDLARQAEHVQWRLDNPEEAAANDANDAERAAEEAEQEATRLRYKAEAALRAAADAADRQWRECYPEEAAAYDLAECIAQRAEYRQTPEEDAQWAKENPEDPAADAKWRQEYPQEAAEWDAGVVKYFAGDAGNDVQDPSELHAARWDRENPEEAAERKAREAEWAKRTAAETAKHTKALAKNPEKAKAALRKETQKDEMDGEIEDAKEDAKESGERWGDIRNQWIEDWIENNWDAAREAQFIAEDWANYVTKYGAH